jgi:hypothetical protein
MQLNTLIKNKLLYFLYLIFVISSQSFHAVEKSELGLLREEQVRQIKELQAQYDIFSQQSEIEIMESLRELSGKKQQEASNKTNVILVGFCHGEGFSKYSVAKHDPIENSSLTDDELYEKAKIMVERDENIQINQAQLDFVCRPSNNPSSNTYLSLFDSVINQEKINYLFELKSLMAVTKDMIDQARQSFVLLV